MARTGRTSLLATALALLGLLQGAWALPSSKVAFLQHGLAEGEDAVMHALPSGSSRLSALTPQLLSSAIARVMSLDARAEVDTGLPAGDIFNRPDVNVLVLVDGLRPTGAALFEGKRWREEQCRQKQWQKKPLTVVVASCAQNNSATAVLVHYVLRFWDTLVTPQPLHNSSRRAQPAEHLSVVYV